MNDDLKMRGMRERGIRFFIRDYDAEKDEYIFGTSDPEEPQVRFAIDKANPRRPALHGTIMDVIAGRLSNREGVNITLAAMPVRQGKDGENLNEGRLQIVDMAEIDLPPAARKIVEKGKVVGEWSKELDRSVNRFAETLAMDRALDSMVAIAAAQPVYEERILKRAREIALKEMGFADTDPRVAQAELDRFTARSFKEALLGTEQVKNAPGQSANVRYRPLESLARQNPDFAETAARLSKNPGAKPSPASQWVVSVAMNYAIQKAIVLEVADQCAEANVNKEAQDRLVGDGHLLYGHPKRTETDFQNASRETGLAMGSEALGGLMHHSVGEKLKGLKQTDAAFHREVLEELSAVPGYKDMNTSQQFDAYASVCSWRLERYSFRERVAVYEEQIKAAVPEKRQELKQPDENKLHEERAKQIVNTARVGVKGLHHTHKLAEETETIGSF